MKKLGRKISDVLAWITGWAVVLGLTSVVVALCIFSVKLLLKALGVM